MMAANQKLKTTSPCRLVCSLQVVTAAELVSSLTSNNSLHLLTGSGSRLQIRELKHKDWMVVYNGVVLPCRKIHGFRVGLKQNVAVMGQSAVALAKVCHSDTDKWRLDTTMVEFEDWILDLTWIPRCPDQCVVITAHNRLFTVCSITGSILRSHSSEVNCILYSAKLLPHSILDGSATDDSISVFAGTVFNTIVLWQSAAIDTVKSPILHRLHGHKGVIFGISINVDIRCVCSVSDDRSIHVWRWRHKPYITNLSWNNVEFQLVRIFTGHSARVWGSVLLSNMLLVSIGEDANVIVWNWDGSIKRKLQTHKGRNVWCFAVNSNYLVTGGGNASLKIWDFHALLQGDNTESALTAYERVEAISACDFPRALCIGTGLCLAFTDQGCLIGWDRNKQTERKILFQDDNYWRYTVMACSAPCTVSSTRFTIVALGSSSGRVVLVVVDSIFNVKVSDELAFTTKVVSLNWLSQSTRLLVTGCDGRMALYECCMGEQLGTVSAVLQGVYHLPKSKQRFIIATESMVAEDGEEFLICSDKIGNLHTYKLTCSDAGGIQQPHHSVAKSHGSAGLTDMVIRRDVIHTIGRDGNYNRWAVSQGKVFLLDRHKVSTHFDWLAKLIFTDDGNIRILVFHTTEMFVYDLGLSFAVARVQCGGGHRNWDLLCEEHNLWFAFIKDKAVHMMLLPVQRPAYVELTPEFHSSKVTSCHVIPCHEKLALLTCGDDGDLMVGEVVDVGNEWSIMISGGTILGHISNVKCLCYTPSTYQPNSTLLFSGGGRGQLLISAIRMEAAGFLTSVISTIYLSGDSLTARKAAQHDSADSSDSRIMAVTSLPLPHHCYLICTACSDGSVRLVVFDERLGRCTGLVDYTAYEHTHCLLTANCLNVSDEITLLAVGGADGVIIFFNLLPVIDTAERIIRKAPRPDKAASNASVSQLFGLREIVRIRAHQSGVNAMTIHSDKTSSRVTAYSGGDDNCLTISQVDVATGKLLMMQKYTQQHSAQISGIQLLSVNRLVTCSIDQRLHLWTRLKGTYGWRVLDTQFLTLADVSCLSVYRNYVAVAGEGVDVYKYH